MELRKRYFGMDISTAQLSNGCVDYRKTTMILVMVCATISIFCTLAFAQGDISGFAKKVVPSVVTVNVFNREGKWRGGGTGFFVKEEGLLVTNRHVIDGKVRALAKLSNGEFLPVEGVLSVDSNGDLVLLTLGVKGIYFPTLSLTDTEIETGQPIIVIGSPLGHEGTVLNGTVSEVKDVSNFGKIIKHTAPVSKGSSGSPVLNMKGEVIGVVVGYSIVEGESLGFAISVDRVKWLLSHSQATPSELVELVNRDEEIWFGLLLSGRYEELIDYLKKRIRISPHNAMAHFFLGLALAKSSRSNEAIEAYKQAIRIEPDDSAFHYNLGVSYIRLGNYNEAIRAFKKAVRIEPDDAEAFLNLGYSYGELSRHNEAIKAYEQAIRIKPDFAEAHYNLGEAHLKLKKRRMSIEQYKILKNLDSELANKLSNLIYK
jgi:predicted TPR repeat methyltransferase